MTSQASYSGMLVTILQAHSLCKQVRIVETRVFSSNQFFIKIRAELLQETSLQVRIYYNRGYIDYAYQLFTDIPLLRWDNKEDFPHLKTYPHHHHDEQGNVKPSSLKGDPVKDIEVVLEAILIFLSN